MFYTLDGAEPDYESKAIDMEIVDRAWDVLAGYTTVWQAKIPKQPPKTLVRYRIGGWFEPKPTPNAPDLWAQDGQGFWFRFKPEQGITTFAYSVEEPNQSTPGWLDDAVIYQIFLDRFRTSEHSDAFEAGGHKGVHGGTLGGVKRSLDYIRDLGANCIWLSPFHPAETYHRYDSLDFNAVDPILGTLDDVKRLTSEAHAGTHFLMDFVPSHVSWHHPAFLRAQQDQHADTASWFTFYQHPNRYRTFLDLARFLPSLNTNDPGARKHLIDSAVRWLTEYGISGFRLDHVIGPSMDFWVAFRRATKEARPDSFTVGEATDTPDSLRRYRQRLDSILDFPLARALRSTFALGSWSVLDLERFLMAYEGFMECGPDRVSFLDNHDMDRFLFVAENDVERLKMAALCQFSLSPVPAIYYGTEIGLKQERPSSDSSAGGDAQVRSNMIWDKTQWNHDLLAFYRKLTKIRHENRVLRSGIRRALHVDEGHNTYAYIREFDRLDSPRDVIAQACIAAVYNLGEIPRQIALPDITLMPDSLQLETRPGTVTIKCGAVEIEPKAAALLAV